MPVPERGDTSRTNKAAVLDADGTIEVHDRPTPVCGPDDVLVRVEAVGVCGSDVHYFQHGRVGSYVVDSPLVLGHETAGTVVETGSDVDSVATGSRVAIEPGVACGRCDLCRSGHYNLCSQVAFHATPPIDGTLQNYVAARADYVFALPDSVSTEEGALIEPLAVAVWACRKAAIAPGCSVLVTGAGAIGLLALQVALGRGASSVVVTDFDQHRRDLARRFGAAEAVDAGTFPDTGSTDSFDVHLECSGSIDAARAGIASLNPAGTAVLIGMGATQGLDVPVSLLQERELVITGTFRYANCYPAAIDLVRNGRVELTPLISDRFTLDETAIALHRSGQEGTVKNLILPGTQGRSEDA